MTTTGRRALLLVALVVAVLAGLVAMHTISSAGGHSVPGASAIHDTAHDHAIVGQDVRPTVTSGVVDCGGGCTPGHTMLTMACILALVITALVLRIARLGGLRAITAWVGSVRLLADTATSRWVTAPDLHILSISRT